MKAFTLTMLALCFYVASCGMIASERIDEETGDVSYEATPATRFVSSILSFLGPWGALAGTAVTTGTAAYVAVKNGKKRKIAEAGKVAAEEVAMIVMQIIERAKAENPKDMKAWLKAVADKLKQNIADPELYDQILEKASKALL